MVSASRAAAFDILLKVEQQDAYASELLHGDRLNELSPADRGLATEIVMGVLRWQSKLDAEIATVSKQKLDAEVRLALRIALYQMRYLERVPQRAAVNESVELVKRARKRSAVPFVNAVLRKLATSDTAARTPAPGAGAGASAKELAASYAHPVWLVERWIREFGPAATERILNYNQQVPVAALRMSAATDDELRAEGVEVAPGALLSTARRVVSGDVTKTRAFIEGRVAIQDEASQLVALLVGAGRRILDCCAAPGSKTAALAVRNPDARIVAAELHPHRARLLRERVPQANVEVLEANALELPFGAEFDRVLADVPCSGTGTLARNPEIKWKLREDDLADLQQRQVAIVRAALRHVAPGGRLVYSTCSLESEENAAVLEQVISAEARVVDARADLERLSDSGELANIDLSGMMRASYLRTVPGMHPCEGFFAAIIEKTV